MEELGPMDEALERGREAFEAARGIGDRWLEALAAGGMAMTHLMVGEADQSGAWLDRAAAAAMAVASPSMARRLEMWRERTPPPAPTWKP